MLRLLLPVLCLVLAACVDPPREVVVEGGSLPERLGRAPVVAASLLIRVDPEQGDSELFSLRLWATADGAIRLRAKQYDVDFLDALVAANGGYQALLVRERVATAGTLGGPDDPPLLRDLRLLMGELRDGPVPPGVTVAGTPQRWTWHDPLGWDVELDRGADGLPTAKRLLAGGVVQRALEYGPWQKFDGVTRSGQVRLRVTGVAGLMTIRIKSLDCPPTISPERMALAIPDGVERVDPTEFSRRMP